MLKQAAKLSTLPIFSSNMVLQRETINFIKGFAEPSKTLTVKLDGKIVDKIKTSKSGTWKAKIPPQFAGGPHQISIESENEKLILTNIMFGDVWICSGQSNMEWSLLESSEAKQELPSAKNPLIRLFTVPKIAAKSKSNICNGEWQTLSPASAESFSAVAYYFGKKILEHLDVPIGLINASWGGTKAEVWISKEAIKNADFKALLTPPTTNRKPKINPAYRKIANYSPPKWLKRDSDNTLPDPGRRDFTTDWEKPEFNDSNWVPMQIPSSIESHGLFIDGAIWFRKKISIPNNWLGKDLILSLGIIDDFDITWFNGEKVGSTGMETTNWWLRQRKYKIPAQLVKDTNATIAIRMFDRYMNGGLLGPAQDMRIYPDEPGNKDFVPLDGEWLTAIELAVNEGPQPNSMPHSVLFNGMIAPLLHLKIKGAIWYQGESNVGCDVNYADLLSTLILDWRKHWDCGDFPFYIVQLPNYLPAVEQPQESLWAQLRNSQFLLSESLPNCGLAVTIDLGEANDIHPRNKKDVGYRLALQALRKSYRIKNIHADAPKPISATLKNSSIIIEFDTHGSKLKTNDNMPPRGFAIAGLQRDFRWAKNSRIDDNKVILDLPTEIHDPSIVRYAWSDNPQVNLYDEYGLPAMPFEIQIKL